MAKETLVGLQWMTLVLITTFHKRIVQVSTSSIETKGRILGMRWSLSYSYRPGISLWVMRISCEMNNVVQQGKNQNSFPLVTLLPLLRF